MPFFIPRFERISTSGSSVSAKASRSLALKAVTKPSTASVFSLTARALGAVALLVLLAAATPTGVVAADVLLFVLDHRLYVRRTAPVAGFLVLGDLGFDAVGGVSGERRGLVG